MDKQGIPFLTASQLSRLIASKEISPVEATEAYLDRIEQLDGKLNSYITVTRDRALESAREAEKTIALGGYLGPMHGIPVAVKDQFNTADILTTGGSRILSENVPQGDATVVAKLKESGAVLLGKLNMSEFAMAEIYDHPYGTPRNPWNLERNPGTSSSGSANNSGLVGLRPSWGRVSRHGVLGGSWSMDTVGPISRSVEDAAMTIQAIAGHDHRDPYTWKTPVPNYIEALDGNIQGIKIGVIRDKVDSPLLDPEFRSAVTTALGVLGDLGAQFQDVSLPLTEQAGFISMALILVEWASVHRSTFEPNFQRLDHNNRYRFVTGTILPAQAYYKAQKLRAMLRQQILDALEQVDVLVLPGSHVTARPVESEPGLQSKEQIAAGMAGRISFTGPFNLAGTPALTLPCGFSSDDMPMGLQIVGKPFAEEMVLKVAHAYEQNTDWHNRKPPI